MARTKSPYQIAVEETITKKAVKLYKQGYSLRKVELKLKADGYNKSHTWLSRAIKRHLGQLSPA